MTVEEAYAGPVTRKRRSDRAFLIGVVVGIAAGVIATILLNRAADAGEAMDDEAVVELQPAFASASDPTSATTRLPVIPLDGTDTNGAQTAREATQPAASERGGAA